MGYAAKVMRGLLIDYARRRQALKRGGGFAITSLGDEAGGAVADERELIRTGAASTVSRTSTLRSPRSWT